jgi:hypothetical protein
MCLKMWLNGEKLVNFLGKFIGNSNMALPLRERDWVEHGISLKVASLKENNKKTCFLLLKTLILFPQ